LDISRKTATAGERGLLGAAFDPDFTINGYVYYMQRAPGKGRPYKGSSLTADPDNVDRALASSETLLFRLPELMNKNHNGGAMHFGNADDVNERDKLYVAVGENGRENAAQSLSSLLGKILRINKDGTIPEDNPSYTKANSKPKAIWALGLRNPFTFDVQPVTGRTFINDVGQYTWEEINGGKAGANYGWPRYEGPNGGAGFEQPLFAYRHGSSETTGCAITGGTFYEPPATVANKFPDSYTDGYFYSDICSGWIHKFDPVTEEDTSFKSSLRRGARRPQGRP
jgi:glucose/arabinose dehydrogenase